MLKQLRHKRFTKAMNVMLLSSECYWYVHATRSIVPIGNENDNEYKRPRYIPK